MNKKSVSTIVIDSILIALLVPSVLWCLVTSFDLNADISSAVICSMIAAAISAFACSQVKTAHSAAAVCASAFAVLILFLLLEFQSLISQLEYVLNRVLIRYSEYLPVPRSISITSEDSAEATLLLNFIGCVLIFIFVFSVIRLRSSVPVLILSVIFLVPCFILLGTFPDILPLFLAIAAMAVLLITSGLRRHGTAHCGIISAISFVLILCILGGSYALNPPESFEREPWQDDLLLSLRQAVGLEPGGDSPSAGVGGSTADEVDLSLAGPLTQTHDLVMQVYTDYDQTLYLRGMAYANYEDNKWSTLSDSQLTECPDFYNGDLWNPFYSSDIPVGETGMEIVTQNSEEVIYTPYYLSEEPEGGGLYKDICINNSDGKTSYTLSYSPYQPNMNFELGYNSTYLDYRSFVYDNYTQISDELSQELFNLSYDYILGGDYTGEDIIQRIRNLVAASAEYSLNTPQIPEDEDIASYLLTDMETGYCVHFATSAAMLLRAYGIPSRYVTGYCVNVSSDEPYTTITSDNAHAWVEYFADGIGWVPLDATPPSFTPAAYSDSVDEQSQPETQPSTEEETQTEPQTEARSEAQADTQTPESRADDDNDGNLQVNGENNSGVIVPIAVTVLVLVLAVGLRVALTKAVRRRRFSSGDKNQRAKYIYRYIERCAKYSKNRVPEDIYDIGAKASFSRLGVTKQELNILLDYAEKSRLELYRNSSALKKIYYKVILAM